MRAGRPRSREKHLFQSRWSVELLRVLHFETASGESLTGLDATVAAWQPTRIGFLWGWLRWPLIRPVADKVYTRWAASRFNKLYGQHNTEFSQQ